MVFFFTGLLGCLSPSLPDGQWLAGDLHVHSSLGSNDTDGLGLPGVLGAAMATADLDFLFLTDHSNAAGSMHCEDVEDCPNLGPEFVEADWPAGVYPGSEISPVWSLEQTFEPTGHVGCLSEAGFEDLDAFVDRPPGAVTGGEAVQQCLDASGWAIINHPYALAGWVAYDWTSYDFDAIEVYNGGARFDPGDAQALNAWEELVKDDPGLVPVGGSDCHRWGTEPPGDLLNSALGWPLTWVHQRGEESPLDALKAGRVVIAEPGSSLELVAQSRRTMIGPGETISADAGVRLTGQAKEMGLRLELKEVGGDVLLSGALTPGEPLVLEGTLSQGMYYGRIWPEAPDWGPLQGGVAITGVISVEN